MHASAILPALLLVTSAIAQASGGISIVVPPQANPTVSSGSSGSSDSSSSGSSGSSGSSTLSGSSESSGSTGFTAPAEGQQIVQIVSVSDANGSLAYFPNSVQAPVGSIVQFQFHPKNHTVTESTFQEPCKPVAQTNASLITVTRPGLKSGFQPVAANATDTPVYNVLVNDTKPIWIYCGQVNHCEKGMSMVINQNLSSTTNTIQAYQAAAAKLPLTATNTTTASTASGTTAAATGKAKATSATDSVTAAAATASAAADGSGSSDATTTATDASSTASARPSTFTGAAAAVLHPLQNAGPFAVAGALVAGVAALL